MPLLMSLLGGLLALAKPLAGRVLLALGISYVTYQGLSVGIDWLLVEIKNNVSAMPAQVVSFMAFMWVDRAISMIFSAYTAALAIRAAGGTSITKMVTK